MTEKRFWYDFEDVNGHKIVDFKNDKKYSLETIGDFREVVDLLNELNDEVVKGDLFKLTVAMAIQHRINWLKKQIWDNKDRISELQSLKKELKLDGDMND